MKTKKALITGATGQDASYLIELLLKKGYKIYGIDRRVSVNKYWRLDDVYSKVEFINADLTDQTSLFNAVKKCMPDEIYNLGAMSHVGYSFEVPIYTAQATGLSVLYLLEAIKTLKPDCKFYQASTSELFGDVKETPQTEKTPFNPQSPYAVAKQFGHEMVKLYRQGHGIFACSGILFNHESPRRGEDFVTQKIVKGVANYVKNGETFCLGNLDAKRDWGHAKDYVRAMYLMMQKDIPDDFVVSSCRTFTVRDFFRLVCVQFGLGLRFEGKGINEVVFDKYSSSAIMRVDEKFYRPCEVNSLIGDCSKAKNELKWKRKYNIYELVKDMCDAEKLKYKL